MKHLFGKIGLAVLLCATGFGIGPLAADETGATTEQLIAVYRAAAEELGLRDASDPRSNIYLYFDEQTELLYRLSFHGVDPGLLPETGIVMKRTNEDGLRVVEISLYKNATIWVETICIFPPDEKREAQTEARMGELREIFDRKLEAHGG